MQATLYRVQAIDMIKFGTPPRYYFYDPREHLQQTNEILVNELRADLPEGYELAEAEDGLTLYAPSEQPCEVVESSRGVFAVSASGMAKIEIK